LRGFSARRDNLRREPPSKGKCKVFSHWHDCLVDPTQWPSNAKACLRLFDFKSKVQEHGKQVQQKEPCSRGPMSRACGVKIYSPAALGKAPGCYYLGDSGRCDRVDCHVSGPMEPSGASRLRRVVVSVASVASLGPLCLSLLPCLLCLSRTVR